jgi:hypothetical protein
MAVKAVNDSAGPDDIVPTLLVFGAYPCITRDSLPSPFITEQAEAIYKAMKEVRRLYAEQQVNDALAMKNRPNTKLVLTLSLQSDVRVWREKDRWNEPHKLLVIDSQTCTIQMLYRPINFRLTVVKLYYVEDLLITS